MHAAYATITHAEKVKKYNVKPSKSILSMGNWLVYCLVMKSSRGHVAVVDSHIISFGPERSGVRTVNHKPACCCVPQTLLTVFDLQVMAGHLPTCQMSVPLFSHCASNLSVQ